MIQQGGYIAEKVACLGYIVSCFYSYNDIYLIELRV